MTVETGGRKLGVIVDNSAKASAASSFLSFDSLFAASLLSFDLTRIQ